MVIECLSLNRSITLQQLVKETNTNEEDLAKVINNYTVQNDISSNVSLEEFSDLNIQRKVYFDFICCSHIVTNRTNTSVTFELSLFGIMLTMALIRYHYEGIDNIRSPDVDAARALLFYKDITQKKYYDSMARNYPEKLPLIFANWIF